MLIYVVIKVEPQNTEYKSRILCDKKVGLIKRMEGSEA